MTMRQAFELYPTVSRADGLQDITYNDVRSYLDTLGEDSGDKGFSVSSNDTLKALIRDAIRESNEDKIVFTLFNHDFTQSDIAAINMVLNMLALILAVATLIKKR